MDKYDYLKLTLYEYCINKLSRAENNYIQWLNNVQRNRAAQLDLLELILALNEVQVTQNIIYEIQDILRYIVY